MAAIWIILAKTRFPAKLIQTSKERGIESIDFNFDLAGDFLPEYLQRVGARVDRLAEAVQATFPEFEKIIHQSAEIDRQISLAKRIAAYEVPALILGETGTGKELFAEAMHEASSRAEKPFIAVNCGALSRSWLIQNFLAIRRAHLQGQFQIKKVCLLKLPVELYFSTKLEIFPSTLRSDC